MVKLIKEHKGIALFISGLVFNLAESLYFGWGTVRGFNHGAESIAEFICDDIAIIMMFVGAYLAGMKMFKESNNNYNFNTTNINSSNVEEFMKKLSEFKSINQ